MIDEAILLPLIAEGEEVRRLVAARIAELRSRVWWAAIQPVVYEHSLPSSAGECKTISATAATLT
jgi:hypothetical protein